jgi:hypothetical protein
MKITDTKLGQVIIVHVERGITLAVPVKATIIAIENRYEAKRCIGWIDYPKDIPDTWNIWEVRGGLAPQIYIDDLLINSIAAYKYGHWLFPDRIGQFQFTLAPEYPNQKCSDCGIPLPHMIMKACLQCQALDELDKLG